MVFAMAYMMESLSKQHDLVLGLHAFGGLDISKGHWEIWMLKEIMSS